MIGLREGKNREVKRVLEHLGLAVNRLIRISFGPFELGNLPEGAVAELNTRILRDQLGLKLAKQAGVNFDAPVETRREEAPPARDAIRRDRGERPSPAPRGRVDRAEVARELAARGERPETKTPRKRKHVSALRAPARAENAGPRRRVERSATSDRRGREINVERFMTAPRTPAPDRKRDEAPEREARKRTKTAAEGVEKRRFKRPGRDDHADQRDPGLPREGRPFRQGPRREQGGGGDRRSAEPERARPGRRFEGKREGPSREARPSRFGKGQTRGKPQGKPPGRRPPPRS
jgi:23S rRNA pseudouridine2605 synthase